MAQVWMHNGFLQVEGDKMAKSLGNFVTIRELLDGWQGYAWPGEALRFNMLRTHYRQPIDWAAGNLDESHKILWDWYERVEHVEPAAEVPPAILDALADDLNTPQAIAELHRLNRGNEHRGMRAALGLLGLSGQRKAIARRQVVKVEPVQLRVIGGEVRVRDTGPSLDPASIDKQIVARNEARRARNFAEADRIRDELAAMGVVLKDSKDGTTWEAAR
jgi:cysteinyl-tRNA synthetase